MTILPTSALQTVADPTRLSARFKTPGIFQKRHAAAAYSRQQGPFDGVKALKCTSGSCSLLTERHLHAGGAALPQHDLDSTAFKAVQFKAKVLSFNTRTGFASAQIQVCRTPGAPRSE